MLTGNSITLRFVQPQDSLQICRIVNEPIVRQAMVTVNYPFAEADAHEFIKHGNSDYARRFAVLAKDRNEVLGCVSLLEIDNAHCQAELSFFISEQASGKGITTQAAKLILQYAFSDLKLNRIYAFHLVENAASARILEKLDFKLEGVLRERVKKNNRFHDVKQLSLLSREFVQIKAEQISKAK